MAECSTRTSAWETAGNKTESTPKKRIAGTVNISFFEGLLGSGILDHALEVGARLSGDLIEKLLILNIHAGPKWITSFNQRLGAIRANAAH